MSPFVQIYQIFLAEMKEKNSIADRDLNPDLPNFTCWCFNYWAIQNKFQPMIKFLSYLVSSLVSGPMISASYVLLKCIKEVRKSLSHGASFSNLYIASRMWQLILQTFCRFTYIAAHSSTLPLLHLRHRHFTYVTAHSKTLPLLHLRYRLFTYFTWRAADA